MTFDDDSSKHESNRSPSGAAPPPERQPPLGIAHLMTWTLTSAVILALYGAIVDVSEAPPAYQQIVWPGLQIVFSMIYGASIGGLLIAIFRRVKGGPPFPTAPGHWILAAGGLLTVVSWSLYAAIHSLTGAERNLPDYGWYAYYCAGVMAATVLAYASVYWMGRQTGWWRTYFLLAALLAGIQFLAWWRDASVFNYYTFVLSSPRYDMGMDVRRYCLAASALLLLIGVGRDVRRGARRDWLHWTGIVVALATTAAHWSWTMWTWVFAV